MLVHIKYYEDLLMRVLLTGAFGNVGLSTLEELINNGNKVRTFDMPTARNKRKARRYACIEPIWGDIRSPQTLERALAGVDVIIHTAAIIPPLADLKPELAFEVNVKGTENICAAAKTQPAPPRLIYTSSIAVYGDRVNNPYIKVNDEPNPTARDEYAKQKLAAENIIRASGITWAIFRLSYIVSVDRLKMDPLMFELPLRTSIEISDTRDVGLALARSVSGAGIWGRVLHLAGGPHCRISYGGYLKRMTDLFGLGADFFPEAAFSTRGLHCGFMDTTLSQELFGFQRHTLEDFFDQVKKKFRLRAFFTRIIRWALRPLLLKTSPYYCAALKKLQPVPG
jgi:UDP-glucose 4-epimerase